MDDVAQLAQVLSHGTEAERRSAAERLARLGEEARPAAVPIVQALDLPDDALRDWLVAALEDLGPPPAADTAALAALVTQPHLDSAFWAATLLGRLKAAAAPAVPQLTAALAEHPDSAVREKAAWALGRIGPDAAGARAALEASARSESPRLARLSAQALEHIGG